MTFEEPRYPNMPKYKRKEKEILAWLFVATCKIEIQPTQLTITHFNRDFLHRFKQLVRLGRLGSYGTTNIGTWELTDPKEISFLMEQISPYIHTQRQRRIAKLLKQYCDRPNHKTETQLKKLVAKHNVTFNIQIW